MAAKSSWSASSHEFPNYERPGYWAETADELAFYVKTRLNPIRSLYLENVTETQLDQYVRILNRLSTLYRFRLSGDITALIVTRLTIAALNGNAELRGLIVHNSRVAPLNSDPAERMCLMLTGHALQSLEITIKLSDVVKFANMMHTNRKLKRVYLTIDVTGCASNLRYADHVQYVSHAFGKMTDNWAIRWFYFSLGNTGAWEPIVDSTTAKFRARTYCNYALALRNAPLTMYETLWVLDWLPAFSRRYEWCGDKEYDPHRGKKIAIIESTRRISPRHALQ